MNRIIRVLMFMVLIMIGSISGGKESYAAEDADGIQYAISDQQVMITGYIGGNSNLIIPEQIENYQVTSIAESAFSSNTTLESIDLSHTLINSIPDNCFMSALNLKSVIFPYSIKNVGNLAFSGCVSLENIQIPPMCESLGNYAFYECSSLKNVNNKSVCLKAIGKFAFYGCNALELLYVPQNCQIETNFVNPEGNIKLITSSDNNSIKMYYSDYGNLSYISDFEVGADQKQYSLNSSQKVVLSLNIQSSSDLNIVWTNSTSQILTLDAVNCTVEAKEGSNQFICYVSNKVYTHSIVFTISVKTSTSNQNVSKVSVPKVTSIQVSEKSDKIVLSWKKSNVTGYIIYRSNKKKGTYKRIKKLTKTSYTSAKGKRGKKYYYKIRAYKVIAGKTYYGNYSKIISKRLKGIPNTPKLSKVSKKYLKWTRIKGTSGIVVYAKVKNIWRRVTVLKNYHSNGIKVNSKKISAIRIKTYRKVKWLKKSHTVYSKYSNIVRL